jgi:hypothetical protein
VSLLDSRPGREISPQLPRLTPPKLLACRIATRAELRACPVWRSTFAALRKDHRYYEILEDTVRDRFDYRYLVITDELGETLAVQPFFLIDQDMLEGVAALAPIMKALRKLVPRLLMMRTLMLGCTAGEGHLATSPRLPAGEIGKVLAANLLSYARSLGASMVVAKEFPARYREVLDPLVANGYCRVPSMPAVSLDIAHANFDEFLKKGLRANARRHLRKNLAAAECAGITMQVTSGSELVAEEIFNLYLQVFARSEFRFEKLTLDFFQQIISRMPDKARFFTWRQDDQLVACSLSMVEGKTLCLEYFGLDYTVALDLHLYHFTFRDQYNWAVQNGLTRIWSSALGYDPKLHLRFRLEPLDLYVQHVNPLMNGVLQRTLKWLLPARYDETLKKFPNYQELWT